MDQRTNAGLGVRSFGERSNGWLQALRANLFRRRIRAQLRSEVRRRLRFSESLRIIIGAGTIVPITGAAGSAYEGWLVTDSATLDALKSEDWTAFFPKGSIDRIMAEHVLEHWSKEQLRTFLNFIVPFISPAGQIRIAVPDGYHPDPDYIEAVKPGGCGSGANDHKVLYNYNTLSGLLTDAGWSCELLEYFDETAQFHSHPWEVGDGFIQRSQRYDPRNQKHPLSYTSLIADLRPGQNANN